MKKLINLLIVTSVFLTSCSSVVFKEITPKKGKELKKFPKELTGVYTDIQNKDSLVISQDYFRYGNKKTIFHLTEKLEKINLIALVDPVKDTTNLVETFQINPTDKEMKEILKGDFFVKILEFKRLK